MPSAATQTMTAQAAEAASAGRLAGLVTSHRPMHSSTAAGSHHRNG